MRLDNMHYVFFTSDWDYIDIYGTEEAFPLSNNYAMLVFWRSRDAMGDRDLIVW